MFVCVGVCVCVTLCVCGERALLYLLVYDSTIGYSVFIFNKLHYFTWFQVSANSNTDLFFSTACCRG